MAKKKSIKYLLYRIAILGMVAFGTPIIAKACSEDEIISEAKEASMTPEDLEKHATELAPYFAYMQAEKTYYDAIKNNLSKDEIIKARVEVVAKAKDLTYATQDKLKDEIVKCSGIENVLESNIKYAYDSADGSNYSVVITANNINDKVDLYQTTKLPRNVFKTCESIENIFSFGGDGSSDKWDNAIKDYMKYAYNVGISYKNLVLDNYDISQDDFNFKFLGSKYKSLR